MSKPDSCSSNTAMELIQRKLNGVHDLRRPPHKSPERSHVVFYNQPVNGLRKLPNEILEMTMYNLHDLHDLLALVTANPQARALYLRNPVAVVFNLLQESNVGLQIQRLVLASLYLSRHPGSMTDYDDIFWFLDQYEAKDVPLIKRSITRFIEDSGPMKFLLDVGEISKEVTTIEHSLTEVILTKAYERANVVRQQGKPNMEIAQVRGSQLSSLSRTEVHRTRRAIWRLRLYFALWHSEYSPYNQAPFFVRLSVSELEEMDCVYHHLQHQVPFSQGNTRRESQHRAFPDADPRRPDLSESDEESECDSFVDLSYRIPHPSFRSQLSRYRDCVWHVAKDEDQYAKHSLLESTPAATCFSRDRLTRPNKTATPSEPLVDHEPSTGFTILNRSKKLRRLCKEDWQRRCLPMACLLDWGYCIWDKERLHAWGLLDNSDDSADLYGFWTDGIHRKGCAHCSVGCFPDLFAIEEVDELDHCALT
ncbi:MAG: hypothetical protein Q9216_005909 [Gyalolechia sp. 2 TL-2023]